MAKKDDFSFGFTSKKKKEEPQPAPPADGEEAAPDASADPFASSETPADPFGSSDTSSSDPFASSDTPADPFASTDPSADPFASTESSDPFASTDPSADPFASTGSSDPFASTDPSADPFASTESSDPFASTSTEADPFATPSSDSSSDPFASTDDATAVAEAPAEPSADAPADAPEEAQTPAKAEKPKGPQVVVHKQFRILVVGDFSGRTNRELMEIGEAVSDRKVHAVDSDSFERTMIKLKPEIRIPVGPEQAITLRFRKIEDFRPEAILEQVEGFQGLLALRDKLKNTKTFKEAAEQVKQMAGTDIAAPAAAQGEPAMTDFERLINQPVKANAGTADADAFIQSVVAGYGVDAPPPEQAKMVKFVEDALSAGLRAILRHPAFQAVESSWRGVEFLTTRLNTDGDLKIFLFDISKDELYADLNSMPTVDKTGIFQVMVEAPRIPGNEPWSLVVGNYLFEQQPKDIGLLAKVAGLMHEAQIPFLAGATSRVAGFPSFAKFPDSGRWQPPADAPMWEKIRGHKHAAYLGLVAPRFLLRIPYGQKTDAVETFPFEEMPGTPEHNGYLWGNGAFAVAYAMGEAFLSDGWGFEPGMDVTDLPLHMAVVDGDKEMTPCAEGWLSDRIGDVLRNLGLIPLLSVRNAASIKIAGITSVAKGNKKLAASWVGQS